MTDFNCYFCNKRMFPIEGISSLACTQHLNGEIWVIHHYRDDRDEAATSELHKVYFTILRGKDRYGFSIRIFPQTTTICFIPENLHFTQQINEIIRFDSIPDNLTPETAQERLSFYLTFM